MSAIEVNLTLRWGPVTSLARKAPVPVLIFAVAFLGYYLSNSRPLDWYNFLADAILRGDLHHVREPLDWYKHYVYLAVAITQGTLDVASVGIPDFYQDVWVAADGTTKYLPYGPAPAMLLLPFVAIWGSSFSEAYFSMALGAINVVLVWHLLGLLNVSRTTKLLVVPFFAFGTVHFYAATTGTLWYYNHVAAVFFLLLSIIFLLRRTSPVVPAFFLALAFLSRQSTILATPFFLYWMIRQQHPTIFSREALFSRESLMQAGLFVGTLLPFVLFSLWYNDIRFGSPFETGLGQLYDRYGPGASFYFSQFPEATRFDMFDVRNIPLHLYTIFLMPPDLHPGQWGLPIPQPSPYGMSVLLTSPAFIYAAFVKRDDPLKLGSWLAIGLISIPLIIYFNQGWVQFGYRFLLDFVPFLLILTALGFEDNQSPASLRIKVLLVALAIVAGFWGRYWGTELTW
jgi:hypothetical protein